MTDRELMEAILTKITGIETKVDGIDNKVKGIIVQQEEDHAILKALEHNSNVNKAEHDKMFNDITHIKGNVEGIRKDISNIEIITSSNWNDIAKLKAIK
jgi:hypothetical protein